MIVPKSCASESASALRPHQAAAFAVPAALLFGLSLVVKLLAAAERDLDLGAPLVVEEHLERDDGHALAVDRGRELVDLAPVQQQLARPLRRVVETARLEVFGDIGIDQPDFTAPGIGIGFGDGRLALA